MRARCDTHTHTHKLNYRHTHTLTHWVGFKLNNRAFDLFVPSYQVSFTMEVIGSPDKQDRLIFLGVISLFALIKCQQFRFV